MTGPGPAPPESVPPAARIEAFSDAVFAFAATLLVVALEVPATIGELQLALYGFVPFALSFGALVMIWSVHRSFFRRFPLGDRTTVLLNSCLLFVVLFYVYPLKFLSRGIAAMFFGNQVGAGGRVDSYADLAKLFIWYGAGFAAIFLFVAWLYRHAARHAPESGPGSAGRQRARFLSRHYGLFTLVGLFSVALAATGTGLRIALPGWIYGLLGPLCWLHGTVDGRRQRRRTAGD
ncbi:MAG: TMEM175 family protein [Thermoanaerobaculia bacterium]